MFVVPRSTTWRILVMPVPVSLLMLSFAIFRRHYDVTYVRNYTDVDDKIIKRAIEEERLSIEVSEHYITEFKTDMAALNNSVPDHEPKVTDTMDDIVTFVSNLVEGMLTRLKVTYISQFRASPITESSAVARSMIWKRVLGSK